MRNDFRSAVARPGFQHTSGTQCKPVFQLVLTSGRLFGRKSRVCDGGAWQDFRG